MSEIPGLPLRSRWFRQGRLSQMALITGSSTTSSGQSGSSRWTKPLSFLRLLSNIYINIQVGPWHYLWLRTSNILELLKLRYFDFKDCSWTDGFVVRASHISELGESILCIRKSSSLSSDARYFKCGMLFSLISRYLTGFRALNISSVCSLRQDNIFLELAMLSRTRFVWDRTRVRNPSGDTEVQPERFRLFSWSPSHSHRSCRYLNYQLHYISYMKRSNYFSQKHSISIPTSPQSWSLCCWPDWDTPGWDWSSGWSSPRSSRWGHWSWRGDLHTPGTSEWQSPTCGSSRCSSPG